jgi:predicted GIY-YIG superfamily endonuclease
MKNEIIYSYLIEDKKNNLYKIGRSNDPINRFKKLKQATLMLN